MKDNQAIVAEIERVKSRIEVVIAGLTPSPHVDNVPGLGSYCGGMPAHQQLRLAQQELDKIVNRINAASAEQEG